MHFYPNKFLVFCSVWTFCNRILKSNYVLMSKCSITSRALISETETVLTLNLLFGKCRTLVNCHNILISFSDPRKENDLWCCEILNLMIVHLKIQDERKANTIFENYSVRWTMALFCDILLKLLKMCSIYYIMKMHIFTHDFLFAWNMKMTWDGGRLIIISAINFI